MGPVRGLVGGAGTKNLGLGHHRVRREGTEEVWSGVQVPKTWAWGIRVRREDTEDREAWWVLGAGWVPKPWGLTDRGYRYRGGLVGTKTLGPHRPRVQIQRRYSGYQNPGASQTEGTDTEEV